MNSTQLAQELGNGAETKRRLQEAELAAPREGELLKQQWRTTLGLRVALDILAIDGGAYRHGA